MNKQLTTYGLVAAAFVCLWFLFVYTPYHKERKVMFDQITAAEKQLADFQKTIASLPAYMERQKDLASLKSDMNSKLYTKKDVLKLFEELMSKAAALNLTVAEVTPPIEELLYLNTIIPDSSQPQFLNIGLKVTGGYKDFGKFVGMVEQAEYFRGINRCLINGSRDGSTETSYYLGFKALLGRFKDEA